LPKVLAVDPGLHMGWALFEDQRLVASGTWQLKPKSSWTRGQTMAYLESLVGNTLCNQDVTIVYEDVRRHLGTTAAHMYGAITGLLDKISFQKYGTSPATIPVKRAKKFCSGKGNADKTEMIATANRLYNLSLTDKDDNEADAICIGHTYIHDPTIHSKAKATPKPIPGSGKGVRTRVVTRSRRSRKPSR